MVSTTSVMKRFVPGSTMAPRHPESFNMYSTVSPPSFTLIGTGTTPARIIPYMISTNSKRLPTHIASRSPCSSPRATIRLATRFIR